MTRPRFDALLWQGDTITVDGVRFQLYERFDAPPTLADGSFWLFKGRPLIEDYFAVFRRYAGLDVRNLCELGIWESGSVAFWALFLRPDKHVAIDLAPPREPALFKRFLRERDLTTKVITRWLTNQADDVRLREMTSREFGGPLDLVIDDASHCHEPTKASLVTLLPKLREGGIFIVEDWAWHTVPEVRRAFPPDEPGLIPLIEALLPIIHREPSIIRSMDVRPALFVLERGPMPEAEARALLLDRLAPKFEASPPVLTRLIKGSVFWQMARGVRRRLKS